MRSLAGYPAVHVIDLGLQAATDEEIWDKASSRSAVLVTKDRDFALRRVATNDGPTILWVRVGNISNRKLIELALRSLPAIIDAIERDEAVIEFVGRKGVGRI
jgi:predicted nuclease of predicted toxin-antitoxin system